jgi:two-component system, NtrC family, response regulator GlrR
MKTRLVAGTRRLRRERLLLVVSGGPDKGLSVALDEGPVVVGTGSGCALRLSDDTVSSRHCELFWRDGRVTVSDLGSTNGVVLDGVAIIEAFASAGSKVKLAQTTLTLKADKAEEIAVSEASRFGPLIGESPVMKALFAQLEAVAKSDAPLLLEGETGTGKDLTAEAIHFASPRAGGPFVVFDCGAAAATLLEGELFGSEKGAFTGADQTRVGLAEAADGGTLLLDEVGEVPLELQPKLLRLLERREVRRLGSNTARSVDVRIIAATNRSLRAMVKAGTFREDLYFRLAALKVRLPSLRERLDDVPALVDRMMAEHGSKRAFTDLIESDQALLLEHRWPGNVRELRNVVERLLAFSSVPAASLLEPETQSVTDVGAELLPLPVARERATTAFERRYLKEALGRSKGNVSEAARLAQVSRQFLQRLMRKHSLG